MEREEKIAKVKKELRELRYLSHSIDSAMRVKEKYEQRIRYIEGSVATPQEKERKLNATYALIENLSIDKLVAQASMLEAIYIPAIKKLESVDRTIVIDSVFCGLTYRKIADNIGYSQRGIEERMARIYEKLTKL